VKAQLVVLHDSTRDEVTRPGELAEYLSETFNIPTRVAGDFWTTHPNDPAGLSRELASIRVIDPSVNELNPEPMLPEIDFEMRRLSDPSLKSSGTLYDATNLMGLYWDHLPPGERSEDLCHIVLTRELFGTWDGGDLRWHARSIVLGYPSLVSTTGLVEGPAKSTQFYLMLRAGVDPGSLREEMLEDMIDYGDDRTTEILKGYCAQAVYYFVTGEAFCDDVGCRLHNAHWQRDMIYAQIKSPYEFCEVHRKRLDELRRTGDS